MPTVLLCPSPAELPQTVRDRTADGVHRARVEDLGFLKIRTVSTCGLVNLFNIIFNGLSPVTKQGIQQHVMAFLRRTVLQEHKDDGEGWYMHLQCNVSL